MSESIETARLDLIPMTPGFLRASLAGDSREASRRIGLEVPTEWPDDLHVVRMRLSQLEDDPELQPWLTRAMGLRARGQMVGHIGFHTRPGADYLQPFSPGGVEFGFTVFAAHRRRGYAHEASEGLMGWAHSHGVERFVLSISPDNAPSLGLAARLGFHRIGAHEDELDGPEEIFERRL